MESAIPKSEKTERMTPISSQHTLVETKWSFSHAGTPIAVDETSELVSNTGSLVDTPETNARMTEQTKTIPASERRSMRAVKWKFQ